MHPAIRTPNSLVCIVSRNVRRSPSMPDAFLRSSVDVSRPWFLQHPEAWHLRQRRSSAALLALWARSENRPTPPPWTGSAAAYLFLFYDLLFSAFEAVGPLSALSATQRAMLRSSLLSADCNSIFLLRFSHENLPTDLSFLNRFPSMFTHTVFFQHAPTFSLTHAIYLLIFGEYACKVSKKKKKKKKTTQNTYSLAKKRHTSAILPPLPRSVNMVHSTPRPDATRAFAHMPWQKPPKHENYTVDLRDRPLKTKLVQRTRHLSQSFP